MSEPPERLRVLIVDEREDRLATITGIVEGLGHEVAHGDDLEQLGDLSQREDVDVALVGLGLDSSRALDTISRLVHEAACPVIAVLDAADHVYVKEAAKRGVFAYAVMNGDVDELASALDITLRRFAEFRNLQSAFGRRAVIEQAKGILMARNGIDADEAFALLRSHSRRTGERLFDVAEAVIRTHRLMPPAPEQADPSSGA